MKRTLLRTVLRKEVVGLARLAIILLTVFLLLVEFGYHADAATDELLEQLSFGLVVAAAFVTLGSLLRTGLRGEHIRKAEVAWFILALILIIAILAAVALPRFIDAQRDAREQSDAVLSPHLMPVAG